ncbi:alpha/beta fold hydrolase [uncultured Paraglaciecola sp.]|uniref:alpha/beta fold hydrolase n=1 Tax=uncultured Paraglaciecola sp. TaxID=1765024 RepID=UPI0025E9E73A|nr:alpha/beta fold hydrolase [uncultured Paraglaciecola sp.]
MQQPLEFPLSNITLCGIGYGDPSKPMILALHGWLDNAASFQPIAEYLNDYYILAIDITGHGLSSHRSDGANYHLTDFVFDIHELVESQGWSSFVLMGHSMGGVLISTAIAAGTLPEIEVAAIALLGTQIVRRRWYLQVPFVTSLGKLWFTFKSEMDGRKLKIGPENEPSGIAKEYLRWLGLLGRWRLKHNKTPLFAKWQGVTIPVLAMVGKNDQSDPAKDCQRFYELCGSDDKVFKLLAKDEGFSRDFGHIDMIVSKDAAKEVWPELSGWLAEIKPTAG